MTIKTEIGENIDSMFIVIEEEQPETCEYMIHNESILFDMLYKQHITVSNINIRQTALNNLRFENPEKRLSSGSNERFTWSSVLHDKLVALSFTLKHPKYLDEKLSMTDLNQKQKIRAKLLNKYKNHY